MIIAPFSKALGTTNRKQNGDPKIAVLIYSPNCLPSPGGTPWMLVSSHGPLGLIERLQPLFQR
jgi:hypothetical protein